MSEKPDEDRPSIDGIEPRGGRPSHGGTRGGHGQVENAAVRSNRALELRMAGANFQQIADALGWNSKASAFAAVQRALAADHARIADQREEYRALQLARIQRLLRGIWPQAIAGVLPAVEQARRLLEREARLLGLDAPVQVQVSEDQRARLHQLLDGLERDLIRAAEKPTWQPGDTDDAP